MVRLLSAHISINQTYIYIHHPTNYYSTIFDASKSVPKSFHYDADDPLRLLRSSPLLVLLIIGIAEALYFSFLLPSSSLASHALLLFLLLLSWV